MKTTLVAGLAALATLAAVPAFAQAPASTAGMTVDKTTIGAMWDNPAAKAVLQKDLPGIEQFLDQIKDMTLAAVAPMSQGAIDDAKLKQVQADLDKAAGK
ncbi:MAG: hypothetical protein JSR98_02490 [Proteobacteria bacterium]|nr:hypothetical protein [Pseudomonadota bacterium]